MIAIYLLSAVAQWTVIWLWYRGEQRRAEQEAAVRDVMES